jgi:DNA ligase-1
MSSCVKETSSKYLSRPSPPYSASKCPEGKVLKGNDGSMYSVKNGRWVRSPQNTRSRKSPRRKTTHRSKRRSPRRKITSRKSPRRSPSTSGRKRPLSKRKFSVMLAKNYDAKIDPTGWWHSEKLDGVRSIWSTKDFVSRNNKIFNAPDNYKKFFPKDDVLDGELFTKRGDFKGTVSTVSHKTPSEKEWKRLKYMAFDLPDSKEPFEERMKRLKEVVRRSCRGRKDCPIKVVKQTKIKSRSHLSKLHKSITKHKGEGSMLRKSRSPYENKRSGSLLKLKNVYDEDATIIEHEKGQGKYSNMLGKLVVKWKTGKHKGVEFKVGTGLTDEERRNYKKHYPIGKTVRIQFTEIQSSGKPRFPVLVGRHADR